MHKRLVKLRVVDKNSETNLSDTVEKLNLLKLKPKALASCASDADQKRAKIREMDDGAKENGK